MLWNILNYNMLIMIKADKKIFILYSEKQLKDIKILLTI